MKTSINMYMLRMFPCYLKTPAPRRGEIVRQIGQALRDNLENLGKLVCYNIICLAQSCVLIFALSQSCGSDQHWKICTCRVIFLREERKRRMKIQIKIKKTYSNYQIKLCSLQLFQPITFQISEQLSLPIMSKFPDGKPCQIRFYKVQHTMHQVHCRYKYLQFLAVSHQTTASVSSEKYPLYPCKVLMLKL